MQKKEKSIKILIDGNYAYCLSSNGVNEMKNAHKIVSTQAQNSYEDSFISLYRNEEQVK